MRILMKNSRSLGAQMAKMELTNEKEILKFKLSKVIV